MSFTAGVKNLYGCVPGIMKVEYHKLASKNKDFADLLANIYDFLKHKIRFTLIDAILAMEGNGPGNGDIRKLNMVAACADAALLDANLLHLLKSDISSNYVLRSLNITSKDVDKTEFIGDSPNEFNFDGFKFPALRKLDVVPKPIVKLLGKFLWVKAKINEKSCRKCMLCVKSCPVSAIKCKDKSSFPSVDESKCISCFCCHELCPYKAVGFRKSILAKIFIKED
jgi:ferredoxin